MMLSTEMALRSAQRNGKFSGLIEHERNFRKPKIVATQNPLRSPFLGTISVGKMSIPSGSKLHFVLVDVSNALDLGVVKEPPSQIDQTTVFETKDCQMILIPDPDLVFPMYTLVVGRQL